MSNIIALPAPWDAPGGVSTFAFDGHTIRVATIEGEPWFVASDILAALGIDYDPKRGPTNFTRSLSEDERLRLRRSETPNFLQGVFGARGGTASLISESGLYKLILRANSSPKASALQNWVTREVLPSIRKSGAYVAGQETLAPDQQAELATAVAELTALVRGMIAEKEARKVAVSSDFITVRDFLEGIGVSMKQGRRVRLGLVASTLTQSNGVTPPRVYGPKGGYLREYPRAILREALELAAS